MSVGQGFTFHAPSGTRVSHFTPPAAPQISHFTRLWGNRVSHFTRLRETRVSHFTCLRGTRVSHFTRLRGTRVSHFTGLRRVGNLTGLRRWRGRGFTFHGPSGGPGFHISWAFGGPGFFTGLRGARVSQSVPRRRKARSLATKTLTEASCVSTSGHTCAVHVELQLVGILSTNHGILTGKHMRVVVFFCSSQRTAIGRLPP